MIVGNARLAYRKETNTFMNGLTWLFQIIMFLTLGLLVNPHEMLDISVTALLIGVFMILIARPVSVFLCLLPFKGITNKARVFYFLGRTKRSRSYYFCNLSGNSTNSRLKPVVQYRILHYSVIAYYTGNDYFENGTLAQA